MAQRKFLDPSSLTRAERLIAGSAWLGVVNAFLPWWFRTVSESGSQGFNAGLTPAGTATWLCFAAAGLLVLMRNWIWPDPAPRHDGIVYMLLSASALVLLSITSFTLRSAWIGYYVAIALASVLLIGSVLRSRERRSGWR